MSAWTVPSYGDEWAVPGYTEERELGRGASGKVVEAINDLTGQRVAIKYLSPTLVRDTAFMWGFRTEAQMLRSLGVPQVVQVYDYVEEPGQGAAVVTELVDGVPLAEMIAQGQLSPEAALVVLKPGEASTEDEIRDFCRDQIAHYKVPRYVRFVDELPMTVTGKAQKFVMRDQMIAELKLQMKDHQAEGVQEFEQIVKEKPDHPVALRGLAYAALRSGDKQKAVEYFRKAAAVQSDDPHIYYFSATLLSQHAEIANRVAKMRRSRPTI